MNRQKKLMGSFLAFVPRLTTFLSPESLCDKFIARGLPCSVYHVEDGETTIEFEASGDVLYLTVKHGQIEYVEHAPAYGAKPPLAGHISDMLDDFGFDFMDEDDPLWRAG